MTEEYNPYAPPQHEPGKPGAPSYPVRGRMIGDILVMPNNGGAFPALCVKCGTSEGLTVRSQRFSYVPPWARLFGALLLLMLQKKSRFDLPICAPCNTRWRTWNAVMGLGLVGVVAAMLVWGALAAPRGRDGDAAWGFFLGAAVIFGVFVVAGRKRTKHVVVATFIDREETRMRGVHIDVMRAASSSSVA
jgi:hypothetical protein